MQSCHKQSFVQKMQTSKKNNNKVKHNPMMVRGYVNACLLAAWSVVSHSPLWQPHQLARQPQVCCQLSRQHVHQNKDIEAAGGHV
jgi:hypothetical protein